MPTSPLFFIALLAIVAVSNAVEEATCIRADVVTKSTVFRKLGVCYERVTEGWSGDQAANICKHIEAMPECPCSAEFVEEYDALNCRDQHFLSQRLQCEKDLSPPPASCAPLYPDNGDCNQHGWYLDCVYAAEAAACDRSREYKIYLYNQKLMQLKHSGDVECRAEKINVIEWVQDHL
ncbi:unnamed protein product, partial [Mesorhabditis spiculigera]